MLFLEVDTLFVIILVKIIYTRSTVIIERNCNIFTLKILYSYAVTCFICSVGSLIPIKEINFLIMK